MVLVLMGVSGTGKTTVGKILAAELGWAFVEGDDYHPVANVEKMKAEIPLNDEDRCPCCRPCAGGSRRRAKGARTSSWPAPR